MGAVLEFFLIRLSVSVCLHAICAVESADHYLTLPGFVTSLKRDVALQNSTHGVVLLHSLIEMDGFLMTCIIWLLAHPILGRGERERQRGVCDQKLIFVFHVISVAESQFFFNDNGSNCESNGSSLCHQLACQWLSAHL